jgi:hypothetical protein
MVCSGGYVLRYRDGSWDRVRSGLAADVDLRGVAAVSAKKVWVVGGTYKKKTCLGTSAPFLASSSGGRFKAHDLTGLSLGDAVLNAVSAPSSADIWVVGQAQSDGTVSPVLLWFNGASWTQVSVPSVVGSGEAFTAVSASSPTNLWIVGTDSGTGTSVLLHWDGVAWTSYAPPENQQWMGVATSSPDRAWAVGDQYSARWSGSAWTPVHIPKRVALLFGITMSGSSAWAAGEEFAGNQGRAVPIALHSTGGSWHLQAVPDPGESKSQLNQSAVVAVSAASNHFIVAVGQNGIECGTGSGSFADVAKGTTWKAAHRLPALATRGRIAPDCGG